MGRLVSILQRRSPVIHPFGPDATVAAAVAAMAEHRVGAVTVVENDRLIGIFSERDLLRRVVGQGRALETTRLREVMTPDPVTATPDEDRLCAILKMRAVGCRHLPVEVQGAVIDMLSMRDLLFDELQERDREIEALRGYIRGEY